MKLFRALIALLFLSVAIYAQGGMGPGPGTPHSAGACGSFVDIGNGWCKVDHTIAGGNTTSVTTSAINTTGADLIIVVIASYGVNHHLVAADISDSKSNTWSTGVDPGGSSTAALTIAYTKPSSVGSGHTFTVSHASATFPVLAVLAVSGSHATPVDQTNKIDDTNSNTMQTGSITPSQNNCLVISGLTVLAINTGTPTVDSGMTLSDFLNSDGVNYQTGALAYKTQSTAAAINPTWTWAVSGVSTAGIISFKHS